MSGQSLAIGQRSGDDNIGISYIGQQRGKPNREVALGSNTWGFCMPNWENWTWFWT